jgi:hypothetical protein
MNAILLSLLLVLQGIPIQAQQSGTVSGVLKDQAGKPLVGVRMAAVAKPDVPGDMLNSAAMASIAQTDEEGRYTLENVPPGRYYIAAGRVDLQTYFPGTSQITSAREVAVAAGAKIAGIDFALAQASIGRASGGSGGGLVYIGTGVPTSITIPVAVTVENGGAWPISGNGKMTTLVVASPSAGCCSPVTLSAGSVTINNVQVGAYQVTLENLPETFAVKSMTYGSTNLLIDTLKITAANLQPNRISMTIIFASSIGAAAPVTNPTQATLQLIAPLPQDPAALAARSGNAPQPYAPPSKIAITLTRVIPQHATGTRISGEFSVHGPRTVYVSGIAGNTYSNDTFDAYGVPTGRHIITSRDNPYNVKALGASVVVGDGELTGVVLNEVVVLPKSVADVTPPLPAKNHPEGVVRLARLSGTTTEENSQKPLTEGTIIIRGYTTYGQTVDIDSDGHFEIPDLLPGTYEIEVQVFGHANTKRTIEVDDEDLKVDIAARKLF